MADRPPSTQSGFTLIEVLVSALMVGLIGAAAATAFGFTLHSSAELRQRADAQALAQQHEDHLRGLNLNELSNLNQTTTTPQDGSTFTVTDTANYVTDGSGTPSCSNPSADYLQTTSTVTWTGMAANPPVVLKTLLTPTVGAENPSYGSLAVTVLNSTGAGLSGMNVSISGPASDTASTSSNGCVLFGDLQAGTYSVNVTPASGSDVDASTGQLVTANAPDTATATVSAGSTASSPTQFQLDAPGSAAVTFQNLYPNGVTSTTAPADAAAVVMANTAMTSPSWRSCAGSDATCATVASPDASIPASAWGSAGLTAAGLYPYSYAVYPGLCTGDEPQNFSGGSDGTANVTAGGATTVASALKLPSMIVRLYSGTGAGSPGTEQLPAGAGRLVIRDTGCNMSYVGAFGSTVTPTSGQVFLPLNSTYASPDTGLLTDPGMPYGNYSVCYQSGTSAWSQNLVNQGNGEIVPVYLGATKTGSTC